MEWTKVSWNSMRQFCCLPHLWDRETASDQHLALSHTYDEAIFPEKPHPISHSSITSF